MTESKQTRKYAPRPNNTHLTDDHCPRCHLPILTGWDDELAAQHVRLHPATIDHTNAVAALLLGHNITEVRGSHEKGWIAFQSWHGFQVETLQFSRERRNKNFMVWHSCHPLRLTYQPIPAPVASEPVEPDLFNQEADEDLPPY